MNPVAAAVTRRVLLGLGFGLALPVSLCQAQGVEGALNPGVTNAQRAWQHWTLNCQGCHRPDGTGSEGTAPSLAGTVAKFLNVPGGREYLGRVPGVATSPLSNDDLAEVLNWMLWRFDAAHVPANFAPYTAAEIGSLRTQPLRIEASNVRRELLKKADAAHR
jgi:cytochrome c553